MLGEMYKEAISLLARLLKSFSFAGRIYTNKVNIEIVTPSKKTLNRSGCKKEAI